MQQRQRKRMQRLQSAEHEAQAVALAKEGYTTRQIAAKMGYADHSGAARAIRRVVDRLREKAELDAKDYQRRIAADLDHAAEELFEIAETTKDARVKVRALAAVTNNRVAVGHATGAIKLPPPVQVNNTNNQSTFDVSKVPAEDLPTLARILAAARGHSRE